MNYRNLRGLALGLVFGALLAGSGCSSSGTAATAHLGELSTGCFVNSDCTAPLVCAFQRCHAECISTRDCHGVERCVGARQVAHVCQLPEEAHCQTSVDCANGFQCGPDGACRDTCESAADCVGQQRCAEGVCAEPSELDANGALPIAVPYSHCRLNSDCPEGSQCASGNCVAECRQDADCPGSKICDGGACHYPGAGRCLVASDCQRVGAQCLAGRCQCACLADVDCAAGATCDGCACQPGPAPECTTAAQCGTGKRCLEGKCACECLSDRDCAAPRTCNGCRCGA